MPIRRVKTFDFFEGDLVVSMNTTEITCKFCNSANLVKNGTRSGTQYWTCKSCGKSFVANQALPGMKYPIEDVSSALYQFYTGTSLNEISGHFQQQKDLKPSDSTIYSWVSKFGKIAADEAKKHKPIVGDVWIADETVLKIGGKNYWLWDIIDSDTRFLLATHLSSTRTTRDAQILMMRASDRAKKIPRIVVTDQLRSYLDGIELSFGSETKHIQSSPFSETDSTNKIERWHGTLKDRTKVMRGFKSVQTADYILQGWLVFYNYFRPHESLNDKTPAETAKTSLPFKNWLDVVKSMSPLAVETSNGITMREYDASEYPAKPYRRRIKRVRKTMHKAKLNRGQLSVKGIRLTETKKRKRI